LVVNTLKSQGVFARLGTKSQLTIDFSTFEHK